MGAFGSFDVESIYSSVPGFTTGLTYKDKHYFGYFNQSKHNNAVDYRFTGLYYDYVFWKRSGPNKTKIQRYPYFGLSTGARIGAKNKYFLSGSPHLGLHWGIHENFKVVGNIAANERKIRAMIKLTVTL